MGCDNKRNLTYQINGAIFEVNRILGSGFLEKVYENALLIELRRQGMKADAQVPIQVNYKGHVVGEYVADILVEDMVIIELKTVHELDSSHKAQLLNYLKASDMSIGLLVNFKGKKATIRRLVLDEAEEV